MDKIKILVVEDGTMQRQLFEMFIKETSNLECIGTLDDASFAYSFCKRNPVDLVLMDVVTKGDTNGLETSSLIKKEMPHIKIIIVTSMPEVSYIQRAKTIGVEGFWYKEVVDEPIISLINRVIKGELVYPDSTPLLSLGNALSSDFTERELEVLSEMSGGLTNSQIAQKLFMSVATVKLHILKMLQKTGFHNRTELSVKASESGIVIYEGKRDYSSDMEE